jgi:uncharacterized protein (DUF58 family)
MFTTMDDRRLQFSPEQIINGGTDTRNLLEALTNHTDELTLVAIGSFVYVAAMNTQAGWLYFIVAMVIALLFLGFIMPRQALRRVEVTRECPDFCFEGDEVTMRLSITNGGHGAIFLLSLGEARLPDYFEERGEKFFFVPELAPGEKKTFDYVLRTARRGIIRLPATKVSTSFPFGLFRKTVIAPTEKCLTIYPVAPAPRRLRGERKGGQLAGHRMNSPLMGHSFDFLGIREYQQSDETRFIHWPSSARLNKLMIKEFSDLRSQTMMVIPDMNTSGIAGQVRESSTEYEVKIATSLLNYSLRQRIALTLLCNQGEQMMMADNLNRFMALEYLASLVPNGKLTISEVLSSGMHLIRSGCHLFIILTFPDIDFNVVRSLIDKKVTPYVVLILGHTFTDSSSSIFEIERYWEIKERLEGMGVPVFMVRKEDNLGGIFDGTVQKAEERMAGEVYTAPAKA